ncbi:MAG: class I SAM-dependent methyltransferase [Clostridia bacterium]|nr:class I SAM-dependent methyltransferase [Clostridia bacterium]
MIVWSEKSIELMCDFASYTHFYEELAKAIAPYIQKGGSVCDAGCGLGFLGAELARYGFTVSGVEKDELAAASAARLNEGAGHLKILCGDIKNLPPKEPYDAMVFCFFGDVFESLRLAKQQCKEEGRAILIKRDLTARRFSLKPTEVRTHTLSDTETRLTNARIPFEHFLLSLEAGQPFRNKQAAMDFFSIYGGSTGHIDEEEVLLRLVEGQPPFPYYLPMERKMGVIIIETKNIEWSEKNEES